MSRPDTPSATVAVAQWNHQRGGGKQPGQPPEHPWSLAQFPGDGRTPLQVGDVLQVAEINPNVTDMHFGSCVSYKLNRASLAPADGRVAQLEAQKAAANGLAEHAMRETLSLRKDLQRANERVGELGGMLITATYGLEFYKRGNASPDLADELIKQIRELLEPKGEG